MVKQLLNRREFIGTTAVAGAGLILASNKVFGQTKSANDKLNIALIGFGAQGRVLLESLLKIDSVHLVAIVDVWEYARTYGERYLKKMGVEVRTYENYEDLLDKEKDLQAVIVATPDFWHAPITNACLKAGLHVYCEKMMSNTIEGARSMVQTMRETGKLLQIGHQRRSNPRYVFALNRLLRDAKLCGRLTAAQAQWNRAVTEDFGWPKKAAMSAPSGRNTHRPAPAHLCA
ncbi:MAG: Gfo/Idh/MocA family oxidoreductase [Limisphaerales bacterium]